jgi:pimeloyl-ACP methyl ester carboxylesterase
MWNNNLKRDILSMARLVLLLLVLPGVLRAGSRAETVDELWADYDPREDSLEARITKEWMDNGNTYRLISYDVGTFKGKKARMAAYYGFPKTTGRVPGLLHIHGGGQRAFLNEVQYYVKRGYACISINWGAKDLGEDNLGQGDITDWGAIDPTQNHPGQYMSFLPGPHTIESHESPKNCSWYPLTIACRRALTFLEQQPEVDPDRLGVYGHSMGGSLTFYVAGTDTRVKAAVPSVGGPGFLSCDVDGLPRTARHFAGSDVEWFRRTMGHQSYAPHVKCPILFLGATNDFNSRMDHVYKTYRLIPHENKKFTFAPHLNHRFSPSAAVCRPLWLDSHLMKLASISPTPQSSLILNTGNHVPSYKVDMANPGQVADVDIYYSSDRDAIARFWRSAQVVRRGDSWIADCPIMSTDEPLFAFANVSYKLDRTEDVLHHGSTDTYTVSSLLHTSTPEQLETASIKATDRPLLLIDDFTNGFRDWYILSKDNPHHWVYSTRKVADSKWRGPPGASLSLKLRSVEDNEIVIVLFENEWRGYRGKRRTYAAEVPLKGSEDWQTVILTKQDFKQVSRNLREEGGPIYPLSQWGEIDRLEIRAYYNFVANGKASKLGTPQWQGPQPELKELRWVPQ